MFVLWQPTIYSAAYTFEDSVCILMVDDTVNFPFSPPYFGCQHVLLWYFLSLMPLPRPSGSSVPRYSKLIRPIKLTLLEMHSKAVQQVSRWSDYASLLAVSKGEHWGEFEGGKALSPRDFLNCCRPGPGFCEVESGLLIKGWATGVFGRCGVLFTLELLQSSFTGILRKRQAGRVPLNSPPQQREDYLNGSGGAECRVNVKWGDGCGRQRGR